MWLSRLATVTPHGQDIDGSPPPAWVLGLDWESASRCLCCRLGSWRTSGANPTTAELSEALGLPPAKVLDIQRYNRDPLSLHTPLGVDGEAEFGDLIEDTEAIAAADATSPSLLHQQFEAALAMLSEREAG